MNLSRNTKRLYRDINDGRYIINNCKKWRKVFKQKFDAFIRNRYLFVFVVVMVIVQ